MSKLKLKGEGEGAADRKITNDVSIFDLLPLLIEITRLLKKILNLSCRLKKSLLKFGKPCRTRIKNRTFANLRSANKNYKKRQEKVPTNLLRIR